MLTLTENARELLTELLTEHSNDPEVGIRLTLEQSGRLGLVLGREGYGDHLVEHQGAKVLLIAPEVAPIVDGVTIDTKDTPDGPKLFVSKKR
jgi:Fe-S cluster assembly iron-binding protein IscA